jgi:hypothetical protein
MATPRFKAAMSRFDSAEKPLAAILAHASFGDGFSAESRFMT